MAWGLEEENGKIFAILSGKKARSGDTDEELGPVETVDHGRTADEVWIRFTGVKNGMRLLRSKYEACSNNQTLKDLKNCTSNGEFINLLQLFSIKRKATTKGRKRKNQQVMPDTESIAPPQETVLTYEQQIIKDKRIGDYKVGEVRLSTASEELRCREIDPNWVAAIKKSLRQAPGSIITKLPALLDPAVVKDPSEFKLEMLEKQNLTIFLLGGNHLLTACRQILQEEPGNDVFEEYRQVQIELYAGLTSEEAKLVGNIHNRRSSNKTIQFQVNA